MSGYRLMWKRKIAEKKAVEIWDKLAMALCRVEVFSWSNKLFKVFHPYEADTSKFNELIRKLQSLEEYVIIQPIPPEGYILIAEKKKTVGG